MKDEKNSGKSISDSAFLDFLSTTVIDMTQKIAGLQLAPSQEIPQDEALGIASFSTRTNGDFRVSLAMSAHIDLLKEITRHMKGQTEVSMGDIEIYGGEYFNIIFGVFLSHVNNLLCTKTYFSVPIFSENLYPLRALSDKHWYVRALSCPYGMMEVGLCKLSEPEAESYKMKE